MHPETLPRLKAPRDDGAVLAYPPLSETGALLAFNAASLAAASIDLQGRTLADLRVLARRETLEAARRYLIDAGEPFPNFSGDHLLLAGHQPELFHPGVWFKNFALQGLAKQHRAVPLNLIVDNDIAKTASLRVPHDTHQVRIPFDAGLGDVPYEERAVLDEQLFGTLPARIEPLTRDWPFRPLLAEFWAETQRRPSPLLGERLAAARRAIERSWGATPLEVPLSRVCQSEAFAWFAIHVLRDLPRFHAAHNGALDTYRRRHELRSPLHPVPDLARDGDWLETPFWAWQTRAQRRQRLWAFVHSDTIQLRAGSEDLPPLTGNAELQVAHWRHLPDAGWKVRTRALTTTLFARLLLGDLFIHGIGGGKYDEVTDGLYRAFFHLEPPGYLVLTATLLLPLGRYPEATGELQRLQRLLRDLHWNPQRYLDNNASTAAVLAKEKHDWIARTCATHQQRAERFAQLRRVNERLARFVQAEQDHVRRAAAQAERQQQLHAVRSSREYAFCLFPEDMLRNFLRPFTAIAPSRSP